jgi:hypothetical protein
VTEIDRKNATTENLFREKCARRYAAETVVTSGHARKPLLVRANSPGVSTFLLATTHKTEQRLRNWRYLLAIGQMEAYICRITGNAIGVSG